MRPALLFVLAFVEFVFPATAHAQSCAGDYTLVTQEEVDAFECSRLRGDISVSGAAITNLDGLSVLVSLDGALSIFSTTALTSLSGIGSIPSISQSISISGNEALVDLDGLGALTFVGGSLTVSNNPVLVDLSGLETITSIGANLLISNNGALQDLNGFSRLDSVGRALSVAHNGTLASLDGLATLTFIGGYLSVIGNPSLTHTDGLASLQSIGALNGSGLTVRDNPRLSRCATGLGPLIAADQNAPATILGPVAIADNAPGGDCNSVQSILDAYLELPAETAPTLTTEALAVYPNPAVARSTFTFALSEPADASLVVYDALGREVARLLDGLAQGSEEIAFDAGALPAGLYVARLVAGERVETVRLSVIH